MPTRHARVLVSVLTAVLAVALLPALPADARARISVVAREVHGSVERERVFALPILASHVALRWHGEHEARVSVAFGSDERFGAPIAIEHDEVGAQRGDGVTYGTVMHADGARSVRVTSDRPIARVTVLALDSVGGGGLALGGSSVAAAVEQPGVISRAGWGADESLRFDSDGSEKWTPAFYPIQKLIVHHTATRNADPDPAATVRSIYYYHAITQGWGDIGYNFLIDEAGRIYEGRYSRPYAAGEDPTGEDAENRGVTAAHVAGYNSGTVGVSLLGTLTSVDATAAARSAVVDLLAWKADRHGIDPHGSSLYTNPVNGTQRTFANVSGHRDLAATECPGGTFYGTFPALRDAVAARMGATSPPAATAPEAPTLAGAALRSKGIELSWTVPADGGSPITGYRVYRATGTGSPTLLATVGATTTKYRDTKVTRRATYTYTVRAVNGVGEGPSSNAVTFTAS